MLCYAFRGKYCEIFLVSWLMQSFLQDVHVAVGQSLPHVKSRTLCLDHCLASKARAAQTWDISL